MNLYQKLTKVEVIVVAFLMLVLVLSGIQIVRVFYKEHSEVIPVSGGVYTEGSVGKIELINPLFVRQGTVNHDLAQLIFSGLTKYDPETGEIVPDLANFQRSNDKKTYTFVIKEGAKWHDGSFVTSDDVIFTYETVIGNPSFRGAILNFTDYSGIKVAKIDERTVEFLLEKPDSFFLVKTLTGLLPKHLLADLPIETLDQSYFNQFPIGSGRYELISATPFENYVEVTLEAFEDFYDKKPNIQTIVIQVFTSYKELIKKMNELDGIRNLPEEYTDKILQKKKLILQRYYLPQYVALFMNTESEILEDNKVRLALQLGTDKESLIKDIGQNLQVDTPLLEIDQSNWVNQYSINKANGALFDTEWKIPEKAEETEEAIEDDNAVSAEVEVKDENDTSEVTFINSPNGGEDWQMTGNRVTITGTVPAKTKTVIVDDYELKKYVPGDPGWSYVASTSFGNLKKGENIYRVYAVDFQENKKLIDAITITYGDTVTFNKEDKEELEKENAMATEIPVRQNKDGELFRLHLITSQNPPSYQRVAELIKEQWKKIGVAIDIEVLENGDFQKRMIERDYDLLIFGQNLGYNLDAYPYWHSSQAKEGGYNLSNFKNFIVDSLLEKARLEHNEDDRKETLSDIQQIISSEIPAVFLYSPTYYLALSDKIQTTTFEHLATSSDRFAGIENWYARGKRKFKEEVGILSFFPWLIKQF